MKQPRSLPLASALLCGALMVACSTDDPSGPTFGGPGIPNGTDPGGGVAGSVGPGDGPSNGQDNGTSGSGGSSSPPVNFDDLDECASISQTAENHLQPADIIIGVDTSGSMGQEIIFVQDNLNAFSQQIIASGVDAHVILVAEAGEGTMMGCTDPLDPNCWFNWGSDFSICIEPPLGSGQCPNDSNLPTYAHIDQKIGSADMLEKFITTYPQYRQHLRDDSFKTFVAITDDDARREPYNSAQYFLDAVSSLESDPNSRMWSEWNYSGIYCFTNCPEAARVGAVHDQLVDMTGGVKGDLCLQNFAPVFDALAQRVVDSVKLACDWHIPPPPDGEEFKRDMTNVKLDLDGAEMLIGKVPSVADCDANLAWHYDDEQSPTEVVACPETCARIQAAQAAKVDILFGCDTIITGPQ